MSEWTTKPLGSMCVKIGSGATPTGGQESYKDEGISLIRSQNVDDFVFLYDGLAHIDDEQARKLNNVIVEANDTLINITGDSVARVCSAPVDIIPARVNQHVSIIRADGIQLDNGFAKYSLLAMKEYLFSISEIGATRRALTKGMLENLEILTPDIEEQRIIAEVLSSLDDKIDLLTRQSATLEALAQTYFRQWFVEEIKENWEEKSLDEIADFLNGLALQKYPYKTGEQFYVVKIKELNSGYLDNSDICSADVPEKYIVNLGDVIFSWSGSLVVDIWKYGKGALNQHLFKVTSEKYPKWFYYYWIKYHLPEFRVIAESKATTMGHIQRGHLSAAKVLVPSNNELEKMDTLMHPLIKKIERNNAQILTLRKLRDALLPKLINGEVGIKILRGCEDL